MDVKFEPLRGMVLIRRLDPEKKIGAIYVPETVQDRPSIGRVAAIGPGHIRDNGTTRQMTVKPGDVVMFEKFSGFDIELGGMEFVVIDEDAIFGRIPQ